MSWSFEPSLESVMEAQVRIAKYLEPTPIRYSERISRHLGCDVFLKMETATPVGAFKVRGALNRLLCLSAKEKEVGVIAASAGNHAQGLAWAGRVLGVSVQVVMPKLAPLVKVVNCQRNGAEVILVGESYDDAYDHAQSIRGNRVYVPAFDDPWVVSGQGTLGLELKNQMNPPDYVLCPIGGGGLFLGTSLALREDWKKSKWFGLQPVGAQSVSQKILGVDWNEPQKTIADGVAVKRPSERMVERLRPRVDEIGLVSEEGLYRSVLTHLEWDHVLVEGAGALGLGFMLENPKKFKGSKVLIVLSGGNMDVTLLGKILERGLVGAGRRLELSIRLKDVPGALSTLTGKIGNLGANIIQVNHRRNADDLSLDETEVHLVLETRGLAHAEEIKKSLGLT